MTNDQKEIFKKLIKDWIFNGVEPVFSDDEVQDHMLKKEILRIMKKEILRGKLQSI